MIKILKCLILHHNYDFSLPLRMRICTSITDAEVERARNVLKTNMLFQLDGMVHLFCIICMYYSTLIHQNAQLPMLIHLYVHAF